VNKKIILLMLLLMCSLVMADNVTNTTNASGTVDEGDYRGLDFEVTDVNYENFTYDYDCINETFNATTNITTNVTYNCTSGINTIITTEVLITQPDYELENTDLIPYDPVDFDSYENIEQKNNTNVDEIIKYLNEPMTEKEENAYTILMIIFIALTVGYSAFKIKKIIKKRKHLDKRTPEEKAKELIDCGMDEAYIEDVFDHLKAEEKKKRFRL